MPSTYGFFDGGNIRVSLKANHHVKNYFTGIPQLG